MITVTTVETEIINRLKTRFKDVTVEGYPEKPQEYALLHKKGAILVVYAGSNYSEVKTTGIVSQEREMFFDIAVLMRNLRNNSGAYDYIEGVKLALIGYKIEGCKKIYMVKDAFVSEDNSIWQYNVTVATKSIIIEEDQMEYAPILKRVTTVDNYDTTEVYK